MLVLSTVWRLVRQFVLQERCNLFYFIGKKKKKRRKDKWKMWQFSSHRTLKYIFREEMAPPPSRSRGNRGVGMILRRRENWKMVVEVWWICKWCTFYNTLCSLYRWKSTENRGDLSIFFWENSLISLRRIRRGQ